MRLLKAMKKRKTGVMVFLSVAAICLIYAAFMILPTLSREKNTITLPPAQSEQPSFSEDEPNSSPRPSTSAGITPENVQQIVAVMERSLNYWQTFTLTTPAGQREIEVFRRGDTFRVTVSGEKSVKNTVISQNDIYIWYDSQGEIYRGVLGSDFTADDEMHIPTYETLINEDTAFITSADYTTLFETREPCITAQTRRATGRVETYWISTVTGLLIKYEVQENGKTVYSLTQQDALSPVTSEDMFTGAFTLPDGSYAEQFRQEQE